MDSFSACSNQKNLWNFALAPGGISPISNTYYDSAAPQNGTWLPTLKVATIAIESRVPRSFRSFGTRSLQRYQTSDRLSFRRPSYAVWYSCFAAQSSPNSPHARASGGLAAFAPPRILGLNITTFISEFLLSLQLPSSLWVSSRVFNNIFLFPFPIGNQHK